MFARNCHFSGAEYRFFVRSSRIAVKWNRRPITSVGTCRNLVVRSGVVTICSLIDSSAERRLRRRAKLSNELQRYVSVLRRAAVAGSRGSLVAPAGLPSWPAGRPRSVAAGPPSEPLSFPAVVSFGPAGSHRLTATGSSACYG